MLILLYFLLIAVNAVEKRIVFDLYISIIQLMNCKYNEIDYSEKCIGPLNNRTQL